MRMGVLLGAMTLVLAGGWDDAAAYDAAQLQRVLAGDLDCRRCDLTGANLSGAVLAGGDFRLADLSFARLAGADLRRADLSAAYLRGVDLEGARLAGATLTLANLMGADLATAWLEGADLATAWCDRTTRLPLLGYWRCAGVVMQRRPLWRVPLDLRQLARDALMRRLRALTWDRR